MSDKEKREPTLWAIGDPETLTHTDMHEAIEEWVENELWESNIYAIPDTVTVTGYARMEISTHLLNPLEHVLEYLDEEFGSPFDSNWTEPTERMKEAEKAFLQVIKEEYVSWACEPVTSETINVRDWISAEMPERFDGS